MKDRPIYTFDTETDPFEYMRIPQVFSCGIWDGETWHYEWGNDCLDRMAKYIADLPAGIIYVHNGGRFDFYLTMQWFDGAMSIINSRIIKAYGLGHEWRDSFAIYPEALKTYKKDDIDIRLLEKNVREKHKEKIVSYMRGDCVYLREIVTRFLEEFGDNLTIGATAMKQIKKYHKFDVLTAEDDARIRSRYYFGGRVQCFEKGILKPTKGATFTSYDINQSYPCSMRNFRHPIGMPHYSDTLGEPRITQDTYFVTVSGYSNGCFAQRDNGGGLHFPIGAGIYSVSIHEYLAAIETDQFVLTRVLETVNFDKSGTFDTFIDTYHELRNEAKRNSDELFSKFYKRVANSGYGKFSQCPDNYKDYVIKPMGIDVPGYEEDFIFGESVLWSKDSEDVSRYNVATGASITGCSRAFLIRALANCNRPVYCDTDSIVCEGMGSDIEIDDYRLGAWKVENIGNRFAVAGRKLYALFSRFCPTCEGEKNAPKNVCLDEKKRDTLFHKFGCVKMACKGVRLTPQEIEQVARGEKVTWKKDAPTYSLKSGVKFLHRDIRMLP